jgi:hypothetical protein
MAAIKRVTASIQYGPEGLLEKTGNALGIASNRDLQRFRDYIEQRGRESGACVGGFRVKENGTGVPADKGGLKPELVSESSKKQDQESEG